MNVEFNIDRPSILVGVLADTHLPTRLKILPPAVLDLFEGVDLILHAGDVDRIEWLAELAGCAPLYAVRGNLHVVDWSDGGQDLPEEVHMRLNGTSIVVTHGNLPGWKGVLLKGPELLRYKLLKWDQEALNHKIIRRLSARYHHADVVIFGHTHHPCVEWVDGTLFLNPGAVCRTYRETPSVGLLRLSGGGCEAQLVTL